MSEKPRLYYFNLRGRAEVARILFAVAKVDFEDVRVEKKEEAKAEVVLPFDQLPVLKYKGIVVSQSLAINRLLAREFGFYGDNNIEMAQIDEICEGVGDLMHAFYAKIRRLVNKPDERAQFVQKFLVNELPYHLKALDQLLKRKNEGRGFFVGSKLSLADVFVYNCFFFLNKDVNYVLLNDYPALSEHSVRVASVPEIAEWLRTRPRQLQGSGSDYD